MELMKYEGLVKKAAVQAARRCGIRHSMEDAIQEAWVAALKALKTFNPTKGQLTTHLWTAVYLQIIDFYGRQEQFPGLPENLDIAVAGDYEYPLWFSFLEPREQEMVSYTFQTTEKKSGIIRHFAQQWGWPAARRVANGIQMKLREA